MRLLHPQADADLAALWYRHRFLASYMVIGGLSLLLEVGILHTLENGFGFPRIFAAGIGVACAVLAAYYLNTRFNFRIPPAKRGRAFRYFALISTFSLALNYLFKSRLGAMGWTYEQSRIATSGALFLIAYTLHRRYSFHDSKQVGVAVYVDRVEDIRGIWEKVGAYPNFIHVDLVDTTVAPDKGEPASNRAEVVRAFWPDKPVHVHVMSRTPSRWLPDLLPYADVIFIHLDLDDPVAAVLTAITRGRRKAGLCVRVTESVDAVRPFLPEIDHILLLAIENPGASGQAQDPHVRAQIREISGWTERQRLTLCVDGGVNEHNIGGLDVELAVSASSVLSSANPQRQILRLQTSSAYEAP